MAKGRVYWLTGLSNSGKTTIGTALYYDLKKTKDNVVILDGDIMKELTSVSSADEFSEAGRLARAKRYSSLSKVLSDQGITVIVCTISMFDEVRAWNRQHIKGYVEVFIDASEDVLRLRDKKGLFSLKTSIQYPKNPDIRIENDGKTPIRSFVEQIKNYIPEFEENYDRDRAYWNQYYAGLNGKLAEPSQFAKDIVGKLKPGKHLLELGCGNGRDSLFFLNNGLRVTAIDASDIAIDLLNQLTKENDNALFVCDNFVKCKILYQMKYDYIYSRFTLHAINEEQENELLNNIKEGLVDGGMLLIEARTTKDEIYGKGERVEKNAYYYNGHYRRFVDVNIFRKKIEEIGLQIISLEERNGFSKTDESDPVLMRCVAIRSDG